MNIKKFALLASVAVRAFNNGPGWKLDADGKLELKDGNPIYVDASGRELTVKGDTISQLNGEAKTHREAKEAAEGKLKAFEGLDPTKAREAIEKLAQIDQGQLIAAGKVDEVRNQITSQFTTQLTERDNANKALQAQIDGMHISSAFTGSEFIRDRVAVPRDMFEATFRNNFKMVDGKLTAYDKSGNPIYSKQNMGQLADAEEAIQQLVDQHPNKDIILKANSGNGTGNGGGGGGNGRVRTMKRSDFEALPAHQQASHAAAMGKGELSIVD